MQTILNKEPDFINDKGTKWWFESEYKGYQIWIIETTEGKLTRVALQKGSDIIFAEDQSLEGIGCKIDVLSLVNN